MIHSSRRKKFSGLLFLFTVFQTFSAAAQTPLRTWARHFGGDWDDVPYAVEPTADGGYVVAGSSGSFAAWNGGFGGNDWLILKLDAAGNLVWQRVYGGAPNEEALAVSPTDDGGFVVAGYSNSFGAGDLDAWILRLDGDGAILWQKAYGGASRDLANAIGATADGGFIVSGWSFSFGAGNADAWELKLDAAGAVVWQKTYGGGALDTAKAVRPTPDGGYIVAGTSKSFGGNFTRVWIFKLDAGGAVEWQKTYRGGVEYDLASIDLTSDGGYVAAGMLTPDYVTHDLWVLKLDAAGSAEWHKAYGGVDDDRGGIVRQTPEGGYALAGTTDLFGAGGGTGEAWILKLDPEGQISWQKTHSTVARERPVALALTGDGGYVAAAAFDPGIPYRFGVFKLDAGGNLPACCDTTATTAVVAVERVILVKDTSAVVAPSSALVSETTTPGGEPPGTWGLPCTRDTPFALYATNALEDTISAYTIETATGALTAVPGSPFASGQIPVELTSDPFGEFVYVSHNRGELRAYRVDDVTGSLSEVAGPPVSAGSSPRSMAVDNSGRRLYVANRDSSSVSGFAIDRATGALTELDGSPFSLGFAPRSLALDPAGRFAYVTDPNGNTVAAYTVDPATGALAETAASPFASGISPAGIALEPSGVFAFVANEFGSSLSVYSIDPTGDLSEVAGSPFSAGARPYPVAVDPTARFLYTFNSSSRDLSAYRIDAASGALAPVPGSPFAALGGGGMAAESSGRTLYVGEYASPYAIAAYGIDATNGALTPVPGSPFATGNGLFALTTTPVQATCDLRAAELALAQTAAPDPVAPGDELTFTITITNPGPDAASDVVVTDLLPAETSFLSCAAPDGTCSGTGRQRIVTIPALDAGASTTVTLVATVGLLVPDNTSFSNTATVGSSTSDPDLGNNSVTTTVSTPFNTPAGTGVAVRPVDPATLTRPVTLTFAAVTQEGTSELAVSGAGPAPPALFKAGVPSLYYELTTSAFYTGPITVCIDYSAASFADETALRLFHHESGAWVDRTTSADPSATTVCGVVTSLSPFAVFEPVQPGSFRFSTGTYSVREDAVSAVVEVQRTGGSDGTVSVTYATADGTATSPDDYAASSGTLTFAAGETTRSFTVAVVDDAFSEADETVGLTLSDPAGGAGLANPSSAVLTILDEDPPPGVVLGDVTLTEGDSGTVEALFSARLPQPSRQSVSADFVTVEGTASGGSDFTGTSGTLDFPPGTTERTARVTVHGDTLDEEDETFFVDLTGPAELYSYVANSGSGDLSVFRVNTLTGEAVEVAGSPVATGSDPRSVVADPHGRFVYVLNTGSGTVSAYRVDAASGALAEIPGSPWAADRWRRATMDPFGRFLYVAHSMVDFISVFAIDGATGALTPVPGSPFATDPDPFMVAVDPSGRFAFVANFSSDSVTGYAVDAATGALTPVPGSPFAAGVDPYAIEVSPGGFVYVANGGTLSAYAADPASGTLTAVAGSPFPAGGSPFGVAADPTGRFLYAGNAGTHDISAYEIDAATGALTPLPGSPFPASDPWDLSMDPAGRFLFAANFASGDMSVYSIDPATGELTPAPGAPAAAGLYPRAVTTQVAGTRGLGKILDDDPEPSLSIDDATVAEHISDPVEADFTVRLSAASGRTVTADFATADATATAPSDYLAASGTVSFPPGTTELSVPVTVQGDARNEIDETFFVRLTAASGATIADDEGLGTILDAPNTPLGAGVVVRPVDLATGAQPVTLTFSNVTQEGTSELDLSDSGSTPPAGFQLGTPQLFYDLSTNALYTGAIAVCVDYSAVSFADETGLKLFHFEGAAWVDRTTTLEAASKTICGEVTSLSPFAVFEPLQYGSLRFSASSYGVGEEEGAITISVTRTGGSDGTVTVAVATSGGSAAAPDDYTAISETLTFAEGETETAFTVTVIDDALSEADETVSLDLSDPAGGATLGSPASAVLTIGDDDPLPGLTIDDVTVTEADVAVEATFTLTLSAASGQEVTVEAVTSDGTATAPDDYEASSDSLTFPAGTTEMSFSVTVLSDALDEDDESFFVDLASAQKASITDARGEGTIVDRPNTALGENVVVTPIDPVTGSQAATLTFATVTQAGKTALRVDTLGPGPPAGFKAGSPAVGYHLTTTALFAGGVTVCIDYGGTSFADESRLKLFHEEGTAWVDRTSSLDPASTTVCGEVTSLSLFAIFEPLQHGSLRFKSASYATGEGGGTVTVAIERLGGSDGAVTVSCATSDGSATAPNDYTANSQTLAFAEGETEASFTVTVNDDVLSEADETVNLHLSGPTGGAALGSPASVVLTIGDDDPWPVLSIGDVTVTEKDQGTAEASFPVSLSAPSGQSVEVSFATADGTAQAGLDYEGGSGTLTFPPEMTLQLLTVSVLADEIEESAETFFVQLSAPAHAVLGDGQGQATIRDSRLFDDGFESGDLTAWSGSVPP